MISHQPGLLEIRGLHTEIPARGRIVRPARGLDLTLYRNECLGVAGESGCGKTMLLLSIIRLLPRRAAITAGSIIFEEKDLVGLSASEMRAVRGRRIAMAFQEPMTALNPVLSIGSQVMESIRLHRRLTRHHAKRRAVELLADLRIPDPERRLDQYPHELSGGMRQRVMLATSIASKPSIILADEPTSSLDVTVQAQIIRLLSALQKQYQISLVFVSHDLALLSQLCHRIAIMYLGRIVEVGTAEEIVTHPRHPYTRALLECIPPLPGERPTRDTAEAKGKLFREVAGELPGPADAIPGCQFHPRCPIAIDRCGIDNPSLHRPTQTHQVACLLAS
ncbi:ABC transporter ATP-binding protein [bacterium]|nr:ABC transporter ATP-binding protein [bacterium]